MTEKITHSEKQNPSQKSDGGSLFLLNIDANERYFIEQSKRGLVSEKRLHEFQEIAKEAREKYAIDREAIEKKFQSEKDQILRDTGIELSKEKAVATLQSSLYDFCGIDRYTYKNSTIGQFQKWVIDGCLVESAELVMLLKEHGLEVFKNLLSWETLKHLVTSIGQPFYSLLVGDSYTRGKNLIGAVLSVMGAAGFVNFLTKWALKRTVVAAAKNTTKQVAEKLAITGNVASKSAPIITPLGATIEVNAASGELILHNISGVPKDLIEREILRVIDTHGGLWKIRTLRLPEKTPSSTKRHLYEILSKNQPLLALERILPESKLVHIKLGGVKAINDAYGQAFWDALGKSTNRIFRNTLEKSEVAGHKRMIGSAHSWAEFSLPKENSVSAVVFAGKNTDQLLSEVFKENRELIARIAKEKFQSVTEVEAYVRKHFQISVWEELTAASKSGGVKRMKELLGADYRAEMAARRWVGSSEPKKLTDSMIAESWKSLLKEEKQLFAKYAREIFVAEGVQYPVVVTDALWQTKIHPKLLGLVRKGEFPPGNLGKDIKQHLARLNEFDYIAPTHNLARDTKVVQRIAEEFKQGVIRTKHLANTFKGTLTNEALYTFAEGKKGMAIFVDIRDMGIKNLDLYQKLGHKVANGAHTMEDLLHAGKWVTDSFIGFVEKLSLELEKKYPGSHIALGGDEVRLFIPKATEKEKAVILQTIQTTLSTQWLEWRVAHAFAKDNIRGVFEKLDKQTSFNKTIEKVLDAHVAESNGVKKAVTTHVEVSPNIPRATLERVIKSEGMQNSIQSLFLEGGTRKIQLESGIIGKLHARQGLYSFEFGY